MTAPVFAKCRCAHTKQRHEVRGFAPQCTAEACTCLEYRPDVSTSAGPATPGRPAGEPTPVRDLVGPTLEQILAAGRRSARTGKLANKIAADIDRLRLRLNEERAIARAKREKEQAREAALADVERLTRELSEARARARGERTPPHWFRAAADLRRLPGDVHQQAGPRRAPRPSARPEGRVTV